MYSGWTGQVNPDELYINYAYQDLKKDTKTQAEAWGETQGLQAGQSQRALHKVIDFTITVWW